MTAADAQIFERGYRRYEGERTGLAGAIKSLYKTSIRSALGLGRSARHKIIPVMVILFSYVPAVVFVGVSALIPGNLEDEFLPTYPQYYGFIAAALFLFAAFVAPELLCTDRRTGMLGVYLASPLDRATYLFGKALAVATILSIVTLGPPLLLLIALTLEGSGPEGWVAGFKLAGSIIAAGAVVSAVIAAVSMAVSASTDRKGAATATIIGLLVGLGVVTTIMVETSGLSPMVRLADVLGLTFELTFRIHGDTGDLARDEVSTWAMWLAAAAIIVGCVAWIWDRYRRMLVRR